MRFQQFSQEKFAELEARQLAPNACTLTGEQIGDRLATSSVFTLCMLYEHGETVIAHFALRASSASFIAQV